MKKDYQDILNSLKEKPPRKLNDHLLIIDGMNTFIRSFSTVKAMNPKGQHIGGLLGTLRSIGYVVRTFSPTRCIVVFDGRGGSMNRKNVDPNYKSNRDHLRVTHWGLFDSRDEERDSLYAQLHRLYDYLECLPLTTISMEKIEADDVISFIAQEYSKEYDSKSIIVSSDKDFLQIVDSNINVYAPIKKKLYSKSNIEEEIKVIPENFLIMKALLGDSSDNLRGIKGAGEKTIIKSFPDIINKKIDLEYIYKTSEEKIEDKKLYSKIIFDWELVERNYDLMNLQTPRLTLEEKNVILEKMMVKIPRTDSGAFQHYLDQDSIESITKNTDSWLDNFRVLTISK